MWSSDPHVYAQPRWGVYGAPSFRHLTPLRVQVAPAVEIRHREGATLRLGLAPVSIVVGKCCLVSWQSREPATQVVMVHQR